MGVDNDSKGVEKAETEENDAIPERASNRNEAN
jgi:hypothetical protein